jgi:hypothetical protein
VLLFWSQRQLIVASERRDRSLWKCFSPVDIITVYIARVFYVLEAMTENIDSLLDDLEHLVMPSPRGTSGAAFKHVPHPPQVDKSQVFLFIRVAVFLLKFI